MAYRGASAAFPEHSVGAYRAAMEQGAQFVECDVVLTKDLVPICRHESNIADTTNVLLGAHRHGWGLGASSNGTQVFAADLTLAQIKQLRAVFPGTVPTAATAAQAGADGEAKGQCDMDAAAGSCAAPWSGAAEPKAAGEGAAVARAETCKWDGATGGAAVGGGPAAYTPACSESVPSGADELASPAYEVATLEELIWMSMASRGPAVGVALHIQAAAWHNAHPVLQPRLAAASTTFEDILLQLLNKYGYAAGPYGSEAWRQRPTYIMAFEAKSLQYLAQRTNAPLTLVLGPTIPDTGETWDSATSEEGLRRIATYAQSLAVARQSLLVPAGPAVAAVAEAAGEAGGDGGLAASPVLARMRQAGLQVFASVFKPAAGHLLPGAASWEQEIVPLLTAGEQLPGGGGDAEAAPAEGQEQKLLFSQRHALGIDGLFADSPGMLKQVYDKYACRD
ncbi:hypothetical protein HYH02_004632 [Chlamydomonas schloesseri]|uniref:glycerophosphodiester phosphodiesterase n=1 Tax=Chlamydomonas schloesseri TaxID=2026947 RepID=A0A835WQF8_9CHLO|nr:hypothetical protein HYH02_004632 [Chlamydomonas schloesseri]|eukprot:KAG2450795.1 hypothetical protein HYH02_004632 [Chlamydomonas schloesseri]